MKIGIVSDTHDNEPNTLLALKHLTDLGCDILFHCGDLAHSDTLKLIAQNFSNPIYIVGGNADLNEEEILHVVKKYSHITYNSKYIEIEFDQINFVIVHKDLDAKMLATQLHPDYLFYGHTHKPWKEKIGNTTLVNPGNICDTRFPATCALFDTTNQALELFQLEKIRRN